MGLVYADLEIINTIDIALAKKSIIGEEEIKSLHDEMESRYGGPLEFFMN